MGRCSKALAASLVLMVTGGSAATAQRPRINKPRPAPPLATPTPLPPAILDQTLAIGGDDVKARKVETRLMVRVQVNGRGPYYFLVDSGADTSVVGLRIARQLELPIGRPTILNGMTERSLVDRVKVGSLALGPSVVNDLELPALREEDMGAQGIIGIDALARRRLMMDFEQRSIKVEDALKPPKPVPGEIVVTAKRRRGQLILTDVHAAGLTLDAVIDTGSQVTIGNLLLRDKLVRRGYKLETAAVTGVTGKTVDVQLAWIPELRIGGITVRNLPIAFADLPPFHVFGISDQPAMLLGADLLETFRRVSLDFQARKVRFQLRRCTDSFVVVNSGLSSRSTRLSSTGAYDLCGR
ncbi:MAG: retroviral-like aspartic protease family protein [Sphingomicrobium sp.]